MVDLTPWVGSANNSLRDSRAILTSVGSINLGEVTEEWLPTLRKNLKMLARAALPAVGDLSYWTAEDVMHFGPALAGLTREELHRLCPVLGAAAQPVRDLLY